MVGFWPQNEAFVVHPDVFVGVHSKILGRAIYVIGLTGGVGGGQRQVHLDGGSLGLWGLHVAQLEKGGSWEVPNPPFKFHEPSTKRIKNAGRDENQHQGTYMGDAA